MARGAFTDYKEAINRLVEPGRVKPFKKRNTFTPKNRPSIKGKLAAITRATALDNSELNG